MPPTHTAPEIPAPVYWSTNILIVLLIASSLCGLLLGGRGFYAADPTTLPQLYGQDIISLAIGLPILLTSMHLVQKGATKGYLLWMGMLFYFAYSYYFYVVGVKFNAMFLGYIAIVALSLYSLITLLAKIEPETIPNHFTKTIPTRPIAAFFLFMAGLFIVLWIGITLSHLNAGSTLPTIQRSVIGLDGMVLLPLMLIGGWQFWYKRNWGYVIAGLLLVNLALLGFTLIVNTGLLMVWHQSVSIVQTILFILVMLGALIGLVAYLDNILPEAEFAPTESEHERT
jgi:hypothetical protein